MREQSDFEYRGRRNNLKTQVQDQAQDGRARDLGQSDRDQTKIEDNVQLKMKIQTEANISTKAKLKRSDETKNTANMNTIMKTTRRR